MVVARSLEWIIVGPSRQLSIMRGGALAVGFARQKGFLAIQPATRTLTCQTSALSTIPTEPSSTSALPC
jgi:hypothetical protein